MITIERKHFVHCRKQEDELAQILGIVIIVSFLTLNIGFYLLGLLGG